MSDYKVKIGGSISMVNSKREEVVDLIDDFGYDEVDAKAAYEVIRDDKPWPKWLEDDISEQARLITGYDWWAVIA